MCLSQLTHVDIMKRVSWLEEEELKTVADMG